jgi:hypothetical protein
MEPTAKLRGNGVKRDSTRSKRHGKVATANPGRSPTMLRIQLNNFRCFAETPQLEVLPITFLVGENSAGKTTFLAAVRLLLETFSRQPQNPFNHDPYYLGGFDQIAHYRGGVRGRAKSFSLEITIPASELPQSVSPSRRQATTTSHKLTFIKGSPQPELCEYEFKTPKASVVLNLEDQTKAKLNVLREGQHFLSYTPKRLPPAPLLRKDVSYLRYVFDELTFGSDVPVPLGEKRPWRADYWRLSKEGTRAQQKIVRHISRTRSSWQIASAE